jgi:hypothetical protein
MTRTNEYHAHTIEVAIESDFGCRLIGGDAARVSYVAIVRIFQAGNILCSYSRFRP